MRPKLIELWASPECSGVSGRVYNLILDNSMCWLCPLVSQCSNILLTKQNQNHFRKDCRLPVQLPRALAAEAEAAREARAKVMKTKQAKLYFLLKSRLSPTPGDRSGRGTKSCSSSEGSIRDHFREFLCDAAEISSSEFGFGEISWKSIISQRQSQNFILLGINFPGTKPHEKSLLSNSNQNIFVGNTTIRQLAGCIWLQSPRSVGLDAVRSVWSSHLDIIFNVIREFAFFRLCTPSARRRITRSCSRFQLTWLGAWCPEGPGRSQNLAARGEKSRKCQRPLRRRGQNRRKVKTVETMEYWTKQKREEVPF